MGHPDVSGGRNCDLKRCMCSWFGSSTCLSMQYRAEGAGGDLSRCMYVIFRKTHFSDTVLVLIYVRKNTEIVWKTSPIQTIIVLHLQVLVTNRFCHLNRKSSKVILKTHRAAL